MKAELKQFDEVVASLTAVGQGFEVNTVELRGVPYRNFAALPANLAQFFTVMLQHAEKDFAVYLKERYTFGQGYQRSCEFGAALVERYGLVKGDRVAILSRNNPQWMMAFVGITSVGGVAVPMNGWWTTEELDYGFSDSGAKIVVADRARVQRLTPIAEKHGLQIIAIDDCDGLGVECTSFDELLWEFSGRSMPEVTVTLEDHATIMYTSGSTGHPKGALSSHRGVLAALYSWMCMGVATKMTGAQVAGDEGLPPCALVTIPLFHCTGSHSAFMLSLVVGRKMVIMHKWDAEEALRLIEAEKVTWFNGVPTMSAELQAAAKTTARDITSLTEIMAGGAARPPEQVKKISGTFKNSTLGIGYGLTETNALGAVNAGAFYVARPDSAGRVVPPVTEFRVVSEEGLEQPVGERGELCIKSPANILGYWNKPEATAEAFVDGWFHTGDIAYLDEDGFLYIVDRMKEIIIRGGENISCIEVEAAIYLHSDILEAAVFGLPDERLGEIVGAAVVLREDAHLGADELRIYLASHLAPFKIPAHIWFSAEQLPRIASGKIFKRQIKADYAAELVRNNQL
ncbi:MAG: class I adenylate-forming enzyme family protein [Halioglobus sp.]|nr:class I adenylate-forming enzyme family protein [Halioglobus sp.]